MRSLTRGVVLLVVSGLVVAGCGREENGTGTGTGEGAEAESVAEGEATGTIEVWAMGTEGENLDVLAEDFMAENPEAEVQVTPVPWEAAHDKIATAIAAGEVPDVSLVGTTWMGEFAATDALDPTPTDLIDEGSFFEGAWDTTVYDGTSYGVPWYVETRLIFYRSDLAEQAGVEEPTDWDSLKAMAAGVQEAGARWGLNLQPGGTGAWQTFMPFAWQNGAAIVDDEGEYALDSPEMVEALEYYASYFSEGLASTAVAQPGELESGFVDGSIGGFVSGPWHVGLVEEQGGEGFEEQYALAHMPEQDAATSFVGGGNLVVFQEAQNRDGAWKFVEYLSRPEVQQKWYETISDLPAVESAWESGALADDPKLALFGEQLQDAQSPPAVPTWEQVAAVVDGQIEAVVVGGADPAAAVAEMQAQAESIGTGE
jgi:multiple sugar transport system substrate-binding protein